MTQATKRVYNCLAIVFDFDDTLATDSTNSLLRSCGINPDTFKKEQLQPLLDDNWDVILANFYLIIEESRRENGCKITKEHLRRVGENIRLKDGVQEMFSRIRNKVQQSNKEVEVEFYIISSGIIEIIQACPIAKEFTAIWASAFHYDEKGEIKFLKKVLTFPEKVRYMLQLSKGKGVARNGGESRPADAYSEISEEELHVPLSQVIYVGDGSSDMPVFHLLHEHQGVAIGVFKGDQTAHQWDGLEKISKARRVDNLASADFREDSELMQSLLLAVESISKRIALSQLGDGE